MAAGLQCLTATPPVLRHFLDLQQQGEKLPPPGSLMAHFSSLLSQMWSGRHSVIRPTEFKQSLGAYHSQFKDYRQVRLKKSLLFQYRHLILNAFLNFTQNFTLQYDPSSLFKLKKNLKNSHPNYYFV